MAKKAISDYQKISKSVSENVDLMLYYVEMGVEFTNTYGDIDEPFYHSMESMYERAANWVAKDEIAAQFQERFRQIVFGAKDIGWGFYETWPTCMKIILERLSKVTMASCFT